MSRTAVKMSESEVMHELESFGTAQNRKIYHRHGINEPMFGVSFAHLEKLKKKLKLDQDLAEKLWATYVLTDAFVSLVGRTALAQTKAEAWIRSEEEWVGSAGWQLVGHLALYDQDLPNSYFVEHLASIEHTIHTSKNRVRYAMNNTLIAIGVRNAALESQAIVAAQRIGKVEVDHGETNCKTPNAIPYIQKTLAHRQKKVMKQTSSVG